MNNIKWLNHFIELVIVILGISIAFSINKYAENRKEQRREAIYLASFLDEINEDIPNLDEIVKDVGRLKQSLNNIVYKLRNEKVDSLNSYIQSGLYTIYVMDPQTTTFESLQSSGNLDLIKNFELRKKLINYNRSIESLEFMKDWDIKHHNNERLAYLPEFIRTSEKDLLKNSKLMALAQIRLFLIGNCISGYKNVKANASELKVLLEKEMLRFE